MKQGEHWTDYPPDDPPQEGRWCSRCEAWDEDCECEAAGDGGGNTEAEVL